MDRNNKHEHDFVFIINQWVDGEGIRAVYHCKHCDAVKTSEPFVAQYSCFKKEYVKPQLTKQAKTEQAMRDCYRI